MKVPGHADLELSIWAKEKLDFTQQTNYAWCDISQPWAEVRHGFVSNIGWFETCDYPRNNSFDADEWVAAPVLLSGDPGHPGLVEWVEETLGWKIGRATFGEWRTYKTAQSDAIRFHLEADTLTALLHKIRESSNDGR